MKVEYQIFIASSLRLQEHRNAVEEVVKKVNNENAEKGNVHFSVFRYENYPDIKQKLEKKDAQEPIDKALRGSEIFLLIIDDVIRDLTQYEFELASQRFKDDKMPHDIHILYKEGTASAETKDGISYARFEKRYNLNNPVHDSHNDVKTHKRVYPIPFDDIEEGENSLKCRVVEILEKILKSGDLPYPGAMRGWHLEEKQFFANDKLRLDNCPKVYYRRKIDDLLDQALQNNRIVLLSGGSLAGKTRAMMEALRSVDDGWVYVFNKSRRCNEDELNEICDEFHKIATYLRNENAPKLYIGFDDIGLFLDNNYTENVEAALRELISAVQDSNGKGVIVATSTNSKVEIPGIENDKAEVKSLSIGDMTDDDFRTAIQYFKSCGISVDSEGSKYKMMGALFVNLKDIRKSYQAFLAGNELGRWIDDDEKEAHCKVRECLLRSIKSQSIWLDQDIGNLCVIQGMTEFFVSRKYKKISKDKELVQEAFNKAIKVLCKNGRMGIQQSGKDKIDIQEYVYNYLIGFDGEVLNDNSTYDILAEKRCIMDILRYCLSSSEAFKADEPLTYHLSRFSSRSTFDGRKEIIGWLYPLWMGSVNNDEIAKDVAPELVKDRERCENHRESSDDRTRTMHHYSHIIETYIYQCCDFSAALQVFDACEESMRTGHLLCAVMRKAETPEDRERIRPHPEYERFKNDSYVIRAEIEWTDGFGEAAAIFDRFNLDKTPAVVASLLLNTTEVPYGIVQLKGSMNELIKRVKTEEDLDAALNLMRKCFVQFVKNHRVLEAIKGNRLIVNEDKLNKLTILDLLSKLPHYSLDQCLHEVFGGDVDASVAFLERLIDSVADTLEGEFTFETEIRLLISWVGSLFIADAAKAGYSFDTVYDTLFLTLQAPHPDARKGSIIFRNTYTYTAMMKCQDCDIVKSINLFENDLVKHADDPQNPIYINRYTLNVLLDKCKKESKDKKQFDVLSYLDGIERLFNQFDIKFDIFSYCRFLESGKEVFSIHDCNRIVKDMSDNNIEHNVFSLTALMACNAVDLSTALSFVDIPAGLIGDYQVASFPDLNLSADKRAVLSDSDEAWSKIFMKPCKTQQDRDVITKLIDYLEKEKSSDFFENGKVYNSIIGNDDYLPTCEEAANFVRQKVEVKEWEKFPDSYTASYIISKAIKKKGHVADRRTSVYKLNDFLKMYPELIKKPKVAAARLRLYQRHNDQLPQVFVEADGKVTADEMPPIKYVETMQRLQIPVNYDVLSTFTSGNIKGVTENIIKRLLKVLVAQQEQGYYPKDGEPYSGKESERVRERYGSFLDEYPKLKMEPESPLAKNKRVTTKFKDGDIDVNEALSRLDWTNENSAVTEFNRILYAYIMKVGKRDEGLFAGVIGYYDRYFGPKSGHTPESYTFAVLAQAILSVDNFRAVIERFKYQHSLHPRITLQPMTLGKLSAVVKDIDTLAKETQAFLNTVGEPNIAEGRTNAKTIDAYVRTANVYLYRIASFLVNKDPKNIRPLLNDVFRYIIKGGDAERALCYEEREYLLMDRFRDPAGISADALRTIIIYNEKISSPMIPDEIVEGIERKYRRHIPKLLNKLVDKGCSKDIMETYVYPLFMRIEPLSRPVLNDNVLRRLADRIPRFDFGAYNELMRQLYTIDCRQIEAVAPGLVNCIHHLSFKKYNDRNLLDAIRKTEAQIFTYSELDRLHCGHLLIEKAPDEYAGWCHQSLNGAKVSRLLENRFGADRQSINDKIKYYINNLDDAFSCSLMVLRKQSLTQDALDDETKEIIERQEAVFTAKIKNGEVSFRDMQKQPLLWLRAKRWPAESLVIAIIRAYLDMTVETDYEAEVVNNLIESLTESFADAKENKRSRIAVKYSVLGSLDTDKIACLVSTRLLAYALYLPVLRRLKPQKEQPAVACSEEQQAQGGDNPTDMLMRCQAIEYYFAEYLKVHPANCQMIESIFNAWREIDWQPSPSMIFAIIQSYSAIVVAGSPDAEKVESCLDKLIDINTYAVKNNLRKLKLFLSVLGYENKGNNKVYISREALSNALPDKYMLMLRLRAKKGERIIYKSKLFNDLKAAERDFFELLTAERVPYPLLILPDLWYKTGYTPYDEKLVLKLIEHYAQVKSVCGRNNSYLDKINRQADFAMKKGYPKTRLNYSLIGICSSECRNYIDVNTDKLKSILNKRTDDISGKKHA